jgi:hypothetical protein
VTYGEFSDCGAVEVEPGLGDECLAWVRDQPVTRRELDGYLATIAGTVVGARLGFDTCEHSGNPSSDAARLLREQWALKSLVRARLLEDERRRRGCDDVRALLAAIADDVGAEPAVDEVECYYRGSPELFCVPEARRVRHVLCRDETDARSVMMQVEAGETLAHLAATRSLDRGSSCSGGDLGEVRRGELAGVLGDAIFAAQPGVLCGPVRSCFGWHVLRVESVRPARRVPLEDVREAIDQHLRHRTRGSAAGSWLEASVRSDTRVAPGFEHPSRHGLPGSTHRH